MHSEDKALVTVFLAGAIIILVLVVLGFNSCNNTNDTILKCVQAGQNVHECREALHN